MTFFIQQGIFLFCMVCDGIQAITGKLHFRHDLNCALHASSFKHFWGFNSVTSFVAHRVRSIGFNDMLGIRATISKKAHINKLDIY